MPRRARSLAIAVATTATFALGCGDRADEPAVATVAAPQLRGAQAQAPPSAVAAALTQIPEGPASQRRLGYVNLERLAEVEDVLPPDAIMRRVLQSGAGRLEAVPDAAVATAVQVGGATVARGPGVREADIDGAPTGEDGVVLGGGEALGASLQGTRPVKTAIDSVADAAVQGCLGDAVAEVVVGAEVLGRDAALGIGLRPSGDKPAGVQLVVCYAPRFLRQIDATSEGLANRYGDIAAGARAPIIGEIELGERELLSAVLPADRLPRAEVEALLGGGSELLALASRD